MVSWKCFQFTAGTARSTRRVRRANLRTIHSSRSTSLVTSGQIAVFLVQRARIFVTTIIQVRAPCTSALLETPALESIHAGRCSIVRCTRELCRIKVVKDIRVHVHRCFARHCSTSEILPLYVWPVAQIVEVVWHSSNFEARRENASANRSGFRRALFPLLMYGLERTVHRVRLSGPDPTRKQVVGSVQ